MLSARGSLAVFLIVVVCGCARMTISTDYDPEASFSGWKTYAWLPEPEKKPIGLHGENPALDKYIRESIDKELATKGYVKQAPESADFLVGYNASLVANMSVGVLNSYYNYPPGWGWNYTTAYAPGAHETQVYEYSVGTLIIDVAGPKTHQLVWRGTAQAELNRRPSLEEKKSKIDKAIRKILERFPPKEKSKS
jgi:hypothetical protein